MKNRWILSILAFSVAINLAVLGTLLYFWSHQNNKPPWAEHPQRGPSRFEFGFDKEQREQIHRAMQEFRQQQKHIADSLRAKRHALLELLLAGEENQQIIDKAINDLVKYQIELERATILHLNEMRPILGPEKWEHLVRAIETGMPHEQMGRLKGGPPMGRPRHFRQPDSILQERFNPEE